VYGHWFIEAGIWREQTCGLGVILPSRLARNFYAEPSVMFGDDTDGSCMEISSFPLLSRR
jgi:hypothetical protein